MKKLFVVAAMSLCTAIFAVEFDLSKASIVMPKKKITLPQEIAKKELELHLNLIAKERNPGEEFKFFIGKRPKNAPKAGEYESYYVIDGKNVYFYGDDRGRLRNQRYGTLFALYTFLEKELGVLWTRPGDDWIVCKERKTVTLPDKATVKFYPPLGMSQLRTSGWKRVTWYNHFAPEGLKVSDEEAQKRFDIQRLWRLRMRHMTREKFKYGHAFRDWQKRFLKDKPEYFGLNPYGTRGLPNHQAELVKLCLSNPAVVDQIIADWVAKGMPKYLNVCPNDGTPGYCFCENCIKLDADLPGERFHKHKTDRFLWFWNRVAEKAVKLRKDVMLVTYIYSYYSQPPRREKIEYPDNLLCGMVPQMIESAAEQVKGWEKVGMKYRFFRPNYLHHRSAMVRGLDRFMYDTFQVCNGPYFYGVDYDALSNRRTQDLEFYVVGRLISNPDKKFEEIIDEYASAFGEAAPEVKKYYAGVRVRGEKELQNMIARIKKLNTSVLDDSHLGRFSAGGHTEADLKNDLEILESALNKNLSKIERKRLNNLIIQVKHQIKTIQFMMAADSGKNVEKKGRELIQFRLDNVDEICDDFGLIFGLGEKKYWGKVKFYQDEIIKSKKNPADPAAGWRASFDDPGLGDWAPRKAYVKVTDKTASFDKFSVELKPEPDKAQIGIWRQSIPASPGAKYHLSWDFKLSGNVKYGAIRVVAVEGKKNTQILRKATRKKNEFWVSNETEFTVPVTCDKIRMYIVTGPGDENSRTYVDNIVLKRLTNN